MADKNDSSFVQFLRGGWWFLVKVYHRPPTILRGGIYHNNDIGVLSRKWKDEPRTQETRDKDKHKK